jgi:hypothetical protein
MIDWFTGDIGVDAKSLALDRILEVSRYGEKIYEIEKWLKVEGSFTDSIQLRRGNPCGSIADFFSGHGEACPQQVAQLSGNPTKFMQGQNCYGPSYSDLGPLLLEVLKAMPCEFQTRFDVPVHPRRIDLTVMVNLGTHERVHEWLRQAADRSRSRHGRPLVSGTTVYWGSKHGWGIKVYCKACELKAHPFGDLKVNEAFQKNVESQLRIELTLRTRELKLCEVINEDLVWKYLERVELGMLKANDLLHGGDLPTASLMVYRAWLSGYALDVDLTRPTFYRHRRRILDEVGVDISTSPAAVLETRQNTIMDLPYLKAHEVSEIPDVFQPYLWRPFTASDLSDGLRDSRRQAQIV